jgi:hypothetical protein
MVESCFRSGAAAFPIENDGTATLRNKVYNFARQSIIVKGDSGEQRMDWKSAGHSPMLGDWDRIPRCYVDISVTNRQTESGKRAQMA